MRYRRQRHQYVFAALLGVIAVVNILFFFILHWPSRAEYFGLRDSIVHLRNEVGMRERSVEQMDKTNVQLARFDQDRQKLFSNHFVQRVPGFATILPRLETMAQSAGVRTSRKTYAIEDIPQFGLYAVTVKLPVQGSYGNVVRFIRELETSDILFLIDSIDVRASDDDLKEGSSGAIALTLSLETFFYQ